MLDKNNHIQYLHNFRKNPDPLIEFFYSQLNLSAHYWALCSLKILKQDEILESYSNDIISFLELCYSKETGGFSENKDLKSPTVLATLSAIQLLCILNKYNKQLNWFNRKKTLNFILSLYNKNGYFYGDKFESQDTRFTYAAISSIVLLNYKIPKNMAEEILVCLRKCLNYDFGFGTHYSSESHGGQMFCVLATIKIIKENTKNKELIESYFSYEDFKRCAFFLLNRFFSEQNSLYGFNGRPGKKIDNCYSWWIFASLKTIGFENFLNKDYLKTFINKCGRDETGGFSSLVGGKADLFHTFFAIGALAMLGDEELEDVDAKFALPKCCINSICDSETFQI